MHSNAFTDWGSVELLTRSEGNQLGDVSANNANVVASYFEVLNVLNISNFELKVRSSHLEGFVGSTFSFVAQSKSFGESWSFFGASAFINQSLQGGTRVRTH